MSGLRGDQIETQIAGQPLGARALLRYEWLRWRTGWVNALTSRRRAIRLRVLRTLATAVIIIGVLTWLALRVFGAESATAAPGAMPPEAPGTALFFSLALLANGVRLGGRAPDALERWFVATGASARAISSRRLVRALIAVIPLAWAPLLPLGDSVLQGGILRAAALTAGGLAFALAGFALGILVRRFRLGLHVGTLLAIGFITVIAGMVGLIAAYTPLLGLGRIVSAPWLWLITPVGPVAALALALAAAVATFAVIRSDVYALGWTTGKPVRERAYTAGAATARTGNRTLIGREFRLLMRLSMNDAIAVAVIAAGTAASIFAISIWPDGGRSILSGTGAALAGLFALLLPAIIAGELVWARKPLSFWGYLRATGGDLRAAARAHTLAATAATLAVAALVAGCVAMAVTIATGEVVWPLNLAAILVVFSVAGAGGGAVGAALALRTGANGTRLAALIRYAGSTSALATAATLIALGYPLVAAAFAGTLFYAAPVAAARLITRTEITPARSS